MAGQGRYEGGVLGRPTGAGRGLGGGPVGGGEVRVDGRGTGMAVRRLVFGATLLRQLDLADARDADEGGETGAMAELELARGRHEPGHDEGVGWVRVGLRLPGQQGPGPRRIRLQVQGRIPIIDTLAILGGGGVLAGGVGGATERTRVAERGARQGLGGGRGVMELVDRILDLEEGLVHRGLRGRREGLGLRRGGGMGRLGGWGRRRGEGVRLGEEAELALGVAALPPAIAVEVVLLGDLDRLAGGEGEFVGILGVEVMDGIDDGQDVRSVGDVHDLGGMRASKAPASPRRPGEGRDRWGGWLWAG